MRSHELNILIAEDNPDDVFILQQAFRKAGAKHRLHDVCDGTEVLAYLKGEGAFSNRELYPFPDLLLLDLNMPRMNGFEVLEWMGLEGQCYRPVVHVLTASCREADIQQAYDLGANSYILKPGRMDELVAFVAALEHWHRFLCLPPSRGVLEPKALVTT